MTEIDLDSPDLTALALGEAEGERLDRALEFLICSEEARAMAAETLRLGEQLTEAFGGEPGSRLSETERRHLLRAARRQLWARRLRRVGLTAAVCALTAAVTLAGVSALPPDGRAAEPGDVAKATPSPAAAPSPAKSGGLEVGLPIDAAGQAGGVYHLSLSADALQTAAEKNWQLAFSPSGEATFGPADESKPDPPASAAGSSAPAAPGTASPGAIDRYVTQRLAEVGIESKEPDDATVLRRLYLDVAGFPPTPQEIDAFAADPSPDKLGKKVTELTNSDEVLESNPAAAYGRFGGGALISAGPMSIGWGGGPARLYGPGYSGDPFAAREALNGRVVQSRTAGSLPAATATAAYPPEVQALVAELRQQEERIRREVEGRVRSERVVTLARLRQLLDEYTRSGRLDEALAVRSVVRKLESDIFDVRPDPGTMSGFRGSRNDSSYVFRVTGNANAGTVWGSGVYTDDSSLAAAAVHAGALRPGESGLVRVTILPGQDSYSGSSQNGVTSHPYHVWNGSYRVERFDPNAVTSVGPAEAVPNPPPSLTAYRGQAGKTLIVRVTGELNGGTVWGTDIYTDDTPLASAAVHAGVLSPGETGLVKVTILAGQPSYTGSPRNGVASHDYGPWDGSYRVERAETHAIPQTGPVEFLSSPSDSLYDYRDRVGQTLTFHVTGEPKAGTVWGSDVYTDDTPLAAAAVHAGVLKAGETGLVRVTILPGQDSYSGSTRNDVTSSGYGPWSGSYRVERADGPAPPSNLADAEPAPVDLTARAGEVGRTFLFRVTGSAEGYVWGSGIYTSDSSLATAAVHAGAVQDGQTGVVRVTVLPGRPHYSGSTRHGVTSRDWQSWGASYRVAPAARPMRGIGLADPNLEKASVDGKYRTLLMKIDAPDDRQPYGEFRDFGFWGHRNAGVERLSYRGHENLPEAYWVYVAPTWYLWAESNEAAPASIDFGAPASSKEATPGAAGTPGAAWQLNREAAIDVRATDEASPAPAALGESPPKETAEPPASSGPPASLSPAEGPTSGVGGAPSSPVEATSPPRER